MPLLKHDAERCLHLLWEYRSLTKDSGKLKAYDSAISGLHAYLSDILPATLPCVKARAKDGIVELFRDQDARVNDFTLDLCDGDKLGLRLDSVDVNESGSSSPIVIMGIGPNSAATRDGRLARGDQVISINGHSMAKVSLQRAQWLLDSAARSGKVTISVISSGLVAGLKLSVSRNDMTLLTPRISQQGHRHRSRSHESLNRIRVKRLLGQQKPQEIKRSHTQIVKSNVSQEKASSSHSSLHLRPGFAPSIGSRHGSDYSLVSSIVDTAAYYARSSIRSSRDGGVSGPTSKRKVRKMHIMKGASGLGLRIIGGKGSKYGDMGIFINQLEGGGAAANDKRLHPGDELLMVDGKTLVGLTHDEAVGVLKGTQKLVQLVIATEYMEGESLASSLHSIPEKLTFNLSGGRQYNDLQDSEPPIGHEIFQSPQRNAFQQESKSDFEMKDISEGYFAKQISGVEQKDTNMDDASEAATRSEGNYETGDRPGVIASATSKQLHGGKKGLNTDDKSEASSSQQAVPPRERKDVVLNKTPGQPLGLKLASGDKKAVKIDKIALGSPADAAANLCIGDQFLSVNGISVVGMSVDQIRGLLSSMPGTTIRLQMMIVEANNSSQQNTLLANQHNIEDSDDEDDDDDDLSPDVPQEMNQTPPLPPSCPRDSESEDRYENESGGDSDGGDSDGDGGRDKVQRRIISQFHPSRPESSVMEISGSIGLAPSFTSNDSLPSTREPLPPLNSSPPSSDSSPPLPPPHISLPPLPDDDGDGDGDEKSSLEIPLGFKQMSFQMKKRTRGSLGVTVIASEGVTEGLFMIRRITNSGVAARDGRLRLGDRLVSVNGEPLLNLTHAEVLQTLSEAARDVELVVWRSTDPNLTSSSMYSLGSYPNLTGSQSSMECVGDSSPYLTKGKYSKGLPSPVRPSRASPPSLTSRFSFAAAHTPPQRESPLQVKRWSVGDMTVSSTKSTLVNNYSPSNGVHDLPDPPPDLPDTPPPEIPETLSPPLSSDVLSLVIPEKPLQELPCVTPGTPPSDLPGTPHSDLPGSLPPDLPGSLPPDLPGSLPPDLPGSLPPDLPGSLPPNLPGSLPPDVSGTHTPDLSGSLPPGLSSIPSLPVFGNLPTEDVSSSCSTTIPDKPLPPPPPPPPPPSSSSPPPPPPRDTRPKSLQVPRGERLENSPFEIELKRGLFGLGASFMMNQMGMLAITSLSTRSVIYQDGNIRVGDILLQINAESVIGWSQQEVEARLKGLPRGLFRLTVMAPLKDVTGEGVATEKNPSPEKGPPPSSSPPEKDRLPSSSLPENQVIRSDEEGVIQVTLSGSPLGLEIEGGTDTTHMYIYIKSLLDKSPAFNCGHFAIGDQVVMVGGICLIGLTNREACDVLQNVPLTVEVVAQRKSLQKQKPESQEELASGESPPQPPQLPAAPTSPQLLMDEAPSQPPQLPAAPTSPQLLMDEAPSQPPKLPAAPTSPQLLMDEAPSQPPQLPVAPISPQLLAGPSDVEMESHSTGKTDQTIEIPEESITVELRRGEGEKLGIGLVGGVDNPTLKQVHVKQILANGVAGLSGSLKRGDHIVSVNGQNLEGLTNKQALTALKKAGKEVTLVLTRKIGRKYSRAPTPLTSTLQSRHDSGEASRVESRRMSPQHSPPTTRGRRGKYSSDEGSRDNSQGPSPQVSKKHRRKESVTTHGEVITFRNNRSTLPRKLKGAKVGVRLVELHKGPTGLGLQLQGGATGSSVPITVKEVLRGGAAFKTGQIHKGDEILEVNGLSFADLNYPEALQAMKGFPQGKVSIILRDHRATKSVDSSSNIDYK